MMYQGGVIDDMTCDKRAHYVCEKTAYTGKVKTGSSPSWLNLLFLITFFDKDTKIQPRQYQHVKIMIVFYKTFEHRVKIWYQ